MDKMVDHLFVFKGNGEVKDILGNYTEYRTLLQADGKKERKEEQVLKAEVPKPKEEPGKRKLSYKEQLEFNTLEEEMEKLEKEKEELTVRITDANLSSEELMKVGDRLTQVMKEIDAKTDRWLELSELI